MSHVLPYCVDSSEATLVWRSPDPLTCLHFVDDVIGRQEEGLVDNSTLVVQPRTAVSHNTNGGNLVLIWEPRTRDLNSSRNLTRKVFSLFVFRDYK